MSLLRSRRVLVLVAVVLLSLAAAVMGWRASAAAASLGAVLALAALIADLRAGDRVAGGRGRAGDRAPGTPRQAPAEPSPAAPSDDGPLVSVVVPCHDEAEHVGETVASVLAQTYDRWECLVVDDGSSDDTVAVARSAADGDERVVVLQHRVNAGLPAARNTGLRVARGEYVVFLDGDDLLLPASLERRVTALRDEPDVVGTVTGVRTAPAEVRLADLPDAWAGGPDRAVDLLSSGGTSPFNVHAALSRTDVLRALGGFDESMTRGAEDWELWSRVLRAGYRWLPSEGVTAVYRQRPGSMVRSRALEHARLSQELLAAAYEPLAPGSLLHAGPAPVLEPLHVLERDAKHARRLCVVTAAALDAGEDDVAAALAAELAALAPAAVATVDLRATARWGRRRTRGVDPAPDAPEVLALATRMAELVAPHARPRPVADAVRRPSVHAAVAVPVTAADAEALLDVLGAWTGADVAVVLLDRQLGDRGAGAVLAEADVPLLSVNEWVLERHRAAVLLAPADDPDALELVRHGVLRAGDTRPIAAPGTAPEVPTTVADDRMAVSTTAVHDLAP